MKSVEFIGNSLEKIKDFPSISKREAGHEIDALQKGEDPTDWKPMSSIASGVREIRIHHEGEYRVIYVTKFKGTIYVLHAFQKKSRKTSKADIETIKRNLKEITK